MNEHYRLRRVQKRLQVVDAHNEQRTLGVIHGDYSTGFEACKPGGEAFRTDVFTTPEQAAEYIHLEFVATLAMDATASTPTTGETS